MQAIQRFQKRAESRQASRQASRRASPDRNLMSSPVRSQPSSHKATPMKSLSNNFKTLNLNGSSVLDSPRPFQTKPLTENTNMNLGNEQQPMRNRANMVY